MISSQIQTIAQPVEESSWLDIFSTPVRVGKNFVVYPFDLLIGASFILSVAIYVKNFISTFLHRKPVVGTTLVRQEREWDKVQTRVVSGLNAMGAIARFIDWGIDKGAWRMTRGAALVCKFLGNFTGIISYGVKAIDCLDELREVKRLSAYAKENRLCKKNDFDACWYSLFCSFAANYSYMLYSGLQLVTLCLGTVIAAEVSALILTVAIVLTVASTFFHMADQTADLKDRLRLCDTRGASRDVHRYTLVRNA